MKHGRHLLLPGRQKDPMSLQAALCLRQLQETLPKHLTPVPIRSAFNSLKAQQNSGSFASNIFFRLRHCDIVETGNESWCFKNRA